MHIGVMEELAAMSLFFTELKPRNHNVNIFMMSEQHVSTHMYHHYALKQANHSCQVAGSMMH